MRHRWTPGLAGLYMMLILGACAPAPQYSFYRLDTSALVEPALEQITGTLLVARPRSSGFTSDRPINFREAGDPLQLKRYRYELWSDQPSRMIQDAIVSSLRRKNSSLFVITPAERALADWIVTGKLHRLEHVRGQGAGRAVIEMELGVSNTVSRQVEFLRCYRQQVDISAGGEAGTESAMYEVVEGFNQAMARLLARFTTDIQPVLAGIPDKRTGCTGTGAQAES